MELLQQVMAKIQPIAPLVLILSFLFVALLLFIVLFRQRHVRNMENFISANFANIRNRMEESDKKQQEAVGTALEGLKKSVEQLITAQQTAAGTAGHTTARVEELGNTLRETVYQVQQAVAASGQGAQVQGAIQKVSESIDELTDELAWTNNWFEDMKALETAVINLVGPAKMRKLIDKERTIAQAAGEELIKKSGL